MPQFCEALAKPCDGAYVRQAGIGGIRKQTARLLPCITPGVAWATMSKEREQNLNLGDLQKVKDELFLENITGPDWLSALEALEIEKNSELIGKLLRIHVPPSWVVKEIGKMLAPPEGYRGAKLCVELPKNSREDAFDELKKKRVIQQKIIQMKDNGARTKAVFADIYKENKISRSAFFEIKRMDHEHEFHKIMGDEPESRKK